MASLLWLRPPNITEILVLLTMAAVSSTEAPERAPVPYSPSALLLLTHPPDGLGGVLPLSGTRHPTPPNLIAPGRALNTHWGKGSPFSHGMGVRAWPSGFMKHFKGFHNWWNIGFSTCDQCLWLPASPAPRDRNTVSSFPPWALQWWPSVGLTNILRNLEIFFWLLLL